MGQLVPGVPLRIDYHASEEEEQALRFFSGMWEGRFEVVRRDSSSDLRAFLQQLLANLMGIRPEQVLGRIDLDRLTADVELLLKA